jgi:hypothetical protein
VGVDTGPQLAVWCDQVSGPDDAVIVLAWPTYVEIHQSTSASADVRRWVSQWWAESRPGWVIVRVDVDPAGQVEILTLRPPP